MCDCLSLTQIIQYREGHSEVADSVTQHLVKCTNCQARLKSITDDDLLAEQVRLAELEQRELGKGSLPDIADYQLIREIGRGGMGVVFEAVQRRLNRPVALKILPSLVNSLRPESAERFKSEAETAAKLQHPNIVPIHDYGQEGGCHFYVMELIVGPSVSEIIGQQSDQETVAPDYYRRVARWLTDVAGALQFAHDQEVIHRDIKPSNLILCENTGRLMISDFGLAKDLSDEAVTHSGQVLGTWRYMSPEQVRSDPRGVDHRTDVYSLGVTMYEMLTFQPAIAGKEGHEILRNVLEHEPLPPRKISPQIPQDLEIICAKAMAKEVRQRYQSAAAMQADLHRFLNDELILARPPKLHSRVYRFVRRNRLVVAIVLAGVLLLTSVLSTAAYFDVTRQQAELRVRYAADLAASARGHLQDGKYHMAVQVYSRALDQDPELVFIYLSRATAYSELGRLDQAIADLDKAIEMIPHHARSQFRRGVLHLMNDQPSPAVVDFDRAIALNPRLTDAEVFRYFSLKAAGRKAGPLPIDTSTATEDFYYVLGELSYLSGDLKPAASWFEKYLALDNRPNEIRLFCKRRLKHISSKSDQPPHD